MANSRRGKTYDMKKVMELYDSGLKPQDIAKRLKIVSVQSLRHSIERVKRKRKELKEEEIRIFKMQEKERLEKEAELESMRKTEERKRKEMFRALLPAPYMGILKHSISDVDLKALKHVMFAYWKDQVLFDDISGEIYVDENLHFDEVQGKLLESGFFLYLTTCVEEDRLIDIRIMHQSPASPISKRDQSMELFHVFYDELSNEKIKLALKQLIVMGFISYQEPDDIHIDPHVDLNDIRNIVAGTGLFGKIVYDPFGVIRAEERRILGRVRNSLITANYISVRELEKMVVSIWDSLEMNALWRTFKIGIIKNDKVTVGEIVDHYLPVIVSLLLQKLNIKSVEIYPPLLDNKHFVNFSMRDFEEKIGSFAEAAILRNLLNGIAKGRFPDLPDVYTT
ncbi:MAG: hypothetical protein QXU18_07340 [Thermoplasmatales archaeon]